MPQLALQFDAQSTSTAQQRAKVFDAIKRHGQYGLTVDGLSEIWGIPPNAISGRFTELKKEGRIKKIGTRRTRSGHAAGVYVAVCFY